MGRPRQVFKKRILVASIASISAMNGVAFAQEGAPIEEVVVTGIRASLENAMDIKRESSGVVDAISAEDIGKFPDSNLAESLQRITGVSIDRQNGEGFQVTARGFGPQYNLIMLNGRSMPASQLGATGNLVNNRAFDMSNIASEGVSGVEVYKTGKANITSGGIGATINLKTVKPLDKPGLNFTVGGKLLNDTSNRIGDDITPEISGLASWADENEVFGIALSFSRQERHSAQTGAYAVNWSDYTGPWTGPDFFPNSVEGVNTNIVNNSAPAFGTQTNLTPGIRYIHGDYERTRTNGQLTLQYRPVENVTATLDYTNAKQESFVNQGELSFWFGGGSFPITDIEFQQNNGVASPLYIWAENQNGWDIGNPHGDPRDIGFAQRQGDVENTLDSIGLNVEFIVNDQFTLTLDAHNSESESTPGSGAVGNWINIGLGSQGVYGQGTDFSGDLPLLVGSYADRYLNGEPPAIGIRDGGDVAGQLDKGDIGSTVRQINNDRIKSTISEVRLDGSYDFDNGGIDFGLEHKAMESVGKRSFDQTLMNGGWSVATPGDVPPELLEELDFGGLFSGYATGLSSESQAFFDAAGVRGSGANSQVFLQGYIATDAAELGERLANDANIPWAPNPDDSVNRVIEEDVTSLYIQSDLEAALGDIQVDILAGVRYEASTVKSTSQVADTTITWQGDNDFAVATGDVSTAPELSAKASYTHVLPSLDLAFHLSDSLISRVSWGKTIARADYNDLVTGVNSVESQADVTAAPFNGAPGAASNGNVGLRPVESNNFDVSLEYYFGDASYISFGYFDKRVPNFIGDEPIVDVVPGTLDASNGPRVAQAIAELETRGLPINQQNVFQMVASQNLGGGCVAADAATVQCGADFDSAPYEQWENSVDIVALSSGVYADPLYVASITTPTNSQDARLNGWEIAAQHFLGDTGFGFQANYTIVNGSVSFDVTADPTATQFALAGLSDSANLTLIYENFGVSARLAYNWREGFLDNTALSVNEPQFTEDYSQLDFNVSYEINDNFIVGLEGINILEEDKRQHGRSSAQLTRLEILGARYALSGRYKF